MQPTTEFSLPVSDHVPLGTAFDIIGKHQFGPLWANDMAAAVRLGRRRAFDIEKQARGQWALKALTQCVENGWLPLVYFADDRRFRYAEGSGGPTLHALYPQPTDDTEGQIELVGGDIFPCMIDTAKLADVLRAKFAVQEASKRGPQRKHLEFREALERLLESGSMGASYRVYFDELRQILPPSSWPPRSTVYHLIDEARKRAVDRILSHSDSRQSRDGQ